MSHFYGTIDGRSKTQATRCGTKSSGLTAVATGWDIGAKSHIYYSDSLQTDVIQFYITDGSNGRKSTKLASFAYINGTLTPLETNFPELFI